MKAQDIMTRDVITARPGMTIDDITRKLVENRISSLPVVTDDFELVGIVSESDLLHRSEIDTMRKRKWWLEIFLDPDTHAREFVKAHGVKVDDLMTSNVITVTADAELVDVAETLDKHRVHRVPVVGEGKLVGIISRGDMVRALASSEMMKPATSQTAGDLHKAVDRAIHAETWIASDYVNYTINDDVVDLTGFVESEDQKRALRILVEGVAGVRKVKDRTRLRIWGQYA